MKNAPSNTVDLAEALLDWFSKNARDLPWRRTSDPYAIWVSEIMLQQTQVKTVIPYWERWMRELPTIQSLAEAPSEKIHKLWEGLGYYTRVRNMQKAAQITVDKYKGVFPHEYEDVLALPGIGRYTAGAICSIAFNQPTPILDGNVIRVLTRVFGIDGNPREKTTNGQLWDLAQELVSQSCENSKEYSGNPSPQSSPHSCVAGRGRKSPALASFAALRGIPSCSFLNQSLMELGALICTPRDPKCLACPVQKLCVAFRENRVAALPNLGERVQTTERRFAAFIVQKENRFLVRQRPAGIVNAHLWEFPNVEILNGNGDLAKLARPFLLSRNVKPSLRIKHSITRYRITLEAFPANLPAKLKTNNSLGTWHSLEALRELAFTSAHRKILERLPLDFRKT